MLFLLPIRYQLKVGKVVDQLLAEQGNKISGHINDSCYYSMYDYMFVLPENFCTSH
jgi:hypothetical protein